jgi:hypothetical protein
MRLCAARSIGKDEARKRGIGKARADFYFVNYRDFLDALRWRLHHVKHMAALVMVTDCS